MTEPTLSSQLLGLVTIFIGIFILMLLTAKNEEEAEQKTVIIIEEAEDFREIARRNLKNSDRKSTYDTQPPVGLPSSIEDEARNNDLLSKQNANLLEENGRLLYKEMTMDFRKNPRKWRAKT